MAKIYGLQGAMSGKLGNSVMAVRFGEQIARQYQPIVANPSTPAQIAARAKLKLMSQLSATMAPFIAMPRVGAVSRRNNFVSKNYGAATYANNRADVNLTDIKLTKGSVAFPAISVVREGAVLSVDINAISAQNFDRVVYVLFERQDDGTLRHTGEAVVQKSEANPTFTAEMNIPYATSTVVIYGYGMRDNTEAARVVFSDMQVTTPAMIANIIASRRLLENDVTLSETRAIISSPQA